MDTIAKDNDMFVIKKWRIETEHIDLTNNFMSEKEFKLTPSFNRRTGKLTDCIYFTSLEANVHNTAETPFPLEISVAMRVVFELENTEGCAKEIETFLKKQAVHLLFPYLRSTVSGLTNLAMVPPVILPIVDAFHLFPESDKGEREKQKEQ
mgnify:CR=1 FL=1